MLLFTIQSLRNKQQSTAQFLDDVVEPNFKGLIADYPNSDGFKRNLAQLKQMQVELMK